MTGPANANTLEFNPIAGHGGNASIESATVLVNILRQLLAKSRGTKPTLKDIEHMFATIQNIRHARVITLKEHSHEQQRNELLETPFHQFVAVHVLPLTDSEDVTFNFSRNMPLAEKLDTVELSSAPKLIPYKDELLSTPHSRGAKKWQFIGFYLSIAALVHYGMWVWSSHYGLSDHLEDILKAGKFTHDPEFPLKPKYIGIKSIDDYLVFLAAIYMTGLNNWNESFGMLQMYFLGMLVQPITVWSIEAYRKRNMFTPLSLYVWMRICCSYMIDLSAGSLSGSYLFSGLVLASTCQSTTLYTRTYLNQKHTGGHSTE